jgi:hypothetical protein
VEEKLRRLHMLWLLMQSFAKVMAAEAELDRPHNRYNRLERELAA